VSVLYSFWVHERRKKERKKEEEEEEVCGGVIFIQDVAR